MFPRYFPCTNWYRITPPKFICKGEYHIRLLSNPCDRPVKFGIDPLITQHVNISTKYTSYDAYAHFYWPAWLTWRPGWQHKYTFRELSPVCSARASPTPAPVPSPLTRSHVVNLVVVFLRIGDDAIPMSHFRSCYPLLIHVPFAYFSLASSDNPSVAGHR